MRPTIAVDFDGTLVTNAYPAFGEWQPGAIKAMRELSKHCRIVVHTSRIASWYEDEVTRKPPAEVQREINGIRQMLDDAGLRHIEIHTRPYKPGAVAYVDDKAVRYKGRKGSWEALVPVLLGHAGIEEVAAE